MTTTVSIEVDQQRLTETLAIRRQADELLRRLEADRAQAEERLTAAGRQDPIKVVTGHSALDQAIADTRRLIGSMDDLLRQLRREVSELGRGRRSNGSGAHRRIAT